MEITNESVSYQDIRAGYIIEKDKYCIGRLFTKSHEKTFLSNPFLKDEKKTFLYFVRVDEEIGGIIMLYPSMMIINDETITTMGASTLEVAEEFRNLAIGVDLMLYPITSSKADIILYAGISEMALPIYKKMGFEVLEYPRAMQLRRSRSLLESKGLSGPLLKILSKILDVGLFIFKYYFDVLIKRLERRYSIKQEIDIPVWVDDILNDDKHKFKECHNRGWLDWNLKHNLHGRKRDVQRFYAIYEKSEPCGFFMIKERFREKAGGVLKNVIIGSVVEWGSFDETKLCEADIYKLASNTFNKDVDIVEFATDNYETIKTMKKYAFIQHGFAHIVVKDLSKRYKDIADIEKWRIRYGYADVILT